MFCSIFLQDSYSMKTTFSHLSLLLCTETLEFASLKTHMAAFCECALMTLLPVQWSSCKSQHFPSVTTWQYLPSVFACSEVLRCRHKSSYYACTQQLCRNHQEILGIFPTEVEYSVTLRFSTTLRFTNISYYLIKI